MTDVDIWTWPNSPTNAAEFDAMLASVDQHLAVHGIPPAQRSFQAARLVSMALKLSGLPFIGADIDRGQAFSRADLGPRVFDWYSENYGDRNKMDFSPGSIVINLRGTLWRLRMPLIYGTAEMFVSRDLAEGDHGNVLSRKPPRCNVLENLVEVTQPYANRLSDHELAHIFHEFRLGYAAIECLTELNGHDLFDQARGDYRHSVDALMDGRTLSKARWDTAQCAEKVLKGLLGRAGHRYPTNARDGHDIVHLGGLVRQRFGLSSSDSALRAIHCPPAVRYGDMNVDLNEAYTSHRELLGVLIAMRLLVAP